MYSQIAANKRKTFLLIAIFLIVITGFGFILSQIENNIIFLIAIVLFAVGYSWFSYYNSAKIALMMSGARPISKKDAPKLYRIVENPTITAGMPMPSVHIIDDPAPNAFATGRDPEHAAVAVTTGLLEMMDDEELQGVIAHELSHIGNYDIRLMGLVIMLVTVIVYLSDFIFRIAFWGDDQEGRNPIFLAIGLLAAIVAPLIAILLQLAVSRKREYLADASGALLTRYPEGLISALRKISQYPKGMRHASNATAHLFIANPLRGKKGGGAFTSLFSTHPPIHERIKRLEDMGDEL